MTDSTEIKLTSFEFKPQPKPLKIRWVKLAEFHLAEELGVYLISEIGRELKMRLLLRAYNARQEAYNRRVVLFMKQTEKKRFDKLKLICS